MKMEMMGPDISKSALVIVDMQNDFVHPDGAFAVLAQEKPDIDMPFLMGANTPCEAACRRLAQGRAACGLCRPCAQAGLLRRTGSLLAVTQPARQQPDLRCRKHLGSADRGRSQTPRWRTFGRQEGLRELSNTPLDTILRNMGVTTCVVSGVTTCVCVSTTVRGGVEHNYRMILVGMRLPEVNRETHKAELETMDRLFADVKTTDEVVAVLAGTTATR